MVGSAATLQDDPFEEVVAESLADLSLGQTTEVLCGAHLLVRALDGGIPTDRCQVCLLPSQALRRA